MAYRGDMLSTLGFPVNADFPQIYPATTPQICRAGVCYPSGRTCDLLLQTLPDDIDGLLYGRPRRHPELLSPQKIARNGKSVVHPLPCQLRTDSGRVAGAYSD